MATSERDQIKLDQLPHLALLHIARYLPRADQSSLSAVCRKLKPICRIASSEPSPPQSIVINGNDQCCRSLILFSNDVLKHRMRFDGIKGFRIRLVSCRQGENCSGMVSSKIVLDSFSAFENLKLNLKYLYMELEEPNLVMPGCPSKESIKKWLQNQMNSLQVLCLHQHAITWIVGYCESQKFNCPYYFENVKHLQVSRRNASPWQIEKILRITPNLKTLHVCGDIGLQYQIPNHRISIVTNLSVREVECPQIGEKLQILVNKLPKLKELDINYFDWSGNPAMPESLKHALKCNHATLKRFCCFSLSCWNYFFSQRQPYFPQCKVLTIGCNIQELKSNLEPLIRLRIKELFPQLKIFRIINLRKENEVIFGGVPISSGDIIIPVPTVKTLEFNNDVSVELLLSLKQMFPSVTSITIRDSKCVEKLGQAWQELEELDIYAPLTHYDQVTMVATMLGIDPQEIMYVCYQNTEHILDFYNVVPIKPIIFSRFAHLKRLTIKYHIPMDSRFLRRMIKIVARWKGSTVMDILPLEFHDYYWNGLDCR